MTLVPLVLSALVQLATSDGATPLAPSGGAALAAPSGDGRPGVDLPKPGWVESFWFPMRDRTLWGFPSTSLCHPGALVPATIPCPCGNAGLAGRGCENSAQTGGALLEALGNPQGSIVLRAEGLTPQALSLFLQGDALVTGGAPFGDGVRCAGGTLRVLYVEQASAGLVHAPGAGEPSVPAASAAQGVPILHGSPRYYQVYYRDPAPQHCPAPAGNTWNVSNAVAVPW